MKAIGKREFLHHASQYLRAVEQGEELTIENRGHPSLKIIRIRKGNPLDIRGCAKHVEIVGDINEPILSEYFDDLA